MALAFPVLPDLRILRGAIQKATTSDIEGTIWSVGRNAIQAVQLPVPIGSVCTIARRVGSQLTAEVIGFEGAMTLLAPLDGADGISPGDRVRLTHSAAQVRVGPEMIGRVVDATATPIDDLGTLHAMDRAPLDAPPITAMQRPPIDQVLSTGLRTIDSLLTLGRGQRIGIFAGSGVGKSTLLAMMARGTDAEVVVIGLIGERGREVQEFLVRELGQEGRRKVVTVVATSDQPALRRVQAAMTATAVAEYFRDQGKDVLLMMDSVTRFAMAQREIGLAAGEAPTTRGYPPSVFAMLPRLVERAGTGPKGSITGIYTVLVEGDDTNEPISDTLRGLLDGHVVLSRKIAQLGRYPAIDVLTSLSRLQSHLATPEHLEAAAKIRQVMAIYKENEDLITIGAYQRGSSAAIDRAVAMKPAVDAFLTQTTKQISPWNETIEALKKLAA